ncbi:TetR/AcrR family transcriptional regulator [Streptomyces mutabilis]|uniref:TetR/AcrR family transcriptional regulator n=1 Tax=Streptomyces mutabilis TaxID=67332 RepID=UPI0022BA1588|nr:TetR/AcrR family transcriptional regulator [Streptomyces mutabilis]MCZ9351504.1 TetR/AcrR family transcriptional regulator [Streptomyces mutabilis]
MTTSKGRVRNKRGEGAQLRDEIVSGATRLLVQGGEHSVTLRAVAREVGISAPAIYQHFADRDAILFAVAEVAFAELELALNDVGDHADPADRLRAVAVAYLTFAKHSPTRYQIMFGGVWDASKSLQRTPSMAADLAELGLGAFRIISRAMADCIEAGRSTGTDPHADATALWAGLHGLAQLQVATPLFPWPSGLQSTLIDRLALLRG